MTADVGPAPARADERVGFGPRLAAWLVDVIAVSVPAVVVGPRIGGRGAAAGILVAVFGLSALYFLVEGFTGRTLGKRLLGLRVVAADGTEPALGQLLMRYALKNIAFLLWLAGLAPGAGILATIGSIGGLVVLIGCFCTLDATRQALHDQVAGTAVLRVPRADVRAAAPGPSRALPSDVGLRAGAVADRVGFGPRLRAWLIDLVVVAMLSVASRLAGGLMLEAAAGRGGAGIEVWLTWYLPVAIRDGLVFVMPFLGTLYFLLEGVAGRTVGKLLLGLRIRDAGGRKASLGQLFGRYALKNVAFLLESLAMVTGVRLVATVEHVGFTVIFLGSFLALGAARQALHDRVVGTAVFRA